MLPCLPEPHPTPCQTAWSAEASLQLPGASLPPHTCACTTPGPLWDPTHPRRSPRHPRSSTGAAWAPGMLIFIFFYSEATLLQCMYSSEVVTHRLPYKSWSHLSCCVSPSNCVLHVGA